MVAIATVATVATIGRQLMQFAPTIAGWFGGKDAEHKVGAAIQIAKTITGTSEPSDAIAMFEKDPALALQFQQSIMSYELDIAREETSRLVAVNQTMQAESKSEHWAQWAWRPFNGFMFACTLFGNYFVIPAFGGTSVEIPEVVLMAWAAVLGVTSWHRGLLKRVREGDVLQPGKLAPINLIKRTLR
ncbi:MAG: hypothetical protein JKX81_13665 [Arenicella sp.]|nr:hypothetical protein [Arenicella sp.]